MFSYFCMILTPEPDRCAALSEEDRAGLVNALKVRSLSNYSLRWKWIMILGKALLLSTIKDKIIPHAVSWFTGEAVQDDDELEIEDEDEEEEEEEEDDDEEEDEDDEDDDDEDEQTKTKKKVNAQYFLEFVYCLKACTVGVPDADFLFLFLLFCCQQSATGQKVRYLSRLVHQS
ncbi:hypothetical protein BHE74_00027516 [Ensete ventricosum]|nr:hypothetical protein BHE74_00027516 [Ensete ventricosum]